MVGALASVWGLLLLVVVVFKIDAGRWRWWGGSCVGAAEGRPC